MDFNKITVFAAMKKRIAWLNQRQEVLAQNIANADTPNYKARDLKPINFVELVKRQERHIPMRVTRARHLSGTPSRGLEFDSRKDRRPYETAPSGNAVVLEEQMLKVSETGVKHKLMTELYKKNLSLFRIAITKR